MPYGDYVEVLAGLLFLKVDELSRNGFSAVHQRSQSY
jgi:hypothetical protein